MMSMSRVLAVARAELRLTRRLVRYWMFLILSYLCGLGVYFYYATIHGLYSSHSATVAAISPRFLVGALGFYYFVIFAVGVVFLGFDVRARDRRERIIEVLDSRPYTNLELVGGKFVGIFVAIWTPVVLLSALWELFGLLLPALGSPVGEPVEIFSLVAFTFFMALPGFAFVLALVFLVTLLVRNRLVSAVLLLVILGADFWAMLWLPLRYGPLCDISGSYIMSFPSEIVPGIADAAGWLQRSAVVVAALGMLGCAAAVHPRVDGGSRGKTLAAGGSLLALAVSLAGFGAFERSSDLSRIEAWREAHATRADEALPDLETVSGEVKIAPGRTLELELELSFRAPLEGAIETALFTLNPGLNVTAAREASGQRLTFSHRDGLLELRLPAPLEPGGESTVHLSIEGRPDPRFGYLYSDRTPESMTASQGQLFLLGFERGLFDRRFVALMPAIRWLPLPGSEKNRDDPRRRVVDFFDVDLTVDVPRDWLVAGPGRRQSVAGSTDGASSTDSARFRFAPPAPVPEVALITSRFESRSMEVEGVMMEILVHPGHTRNLDVLVDAADEVRDWIEERLREAAESGLDYPYDGLTLVEVPNSLRGYAGGWRMDTALAPPAMLLVREMSFPTARFDAAFRDPKAFKDREGGVPRAKRDRLRTYFINDFSGGNVFMGAARNFFVHQTTARGPEGLALNFVMETLSTRLTTETRGYFSAHVFDSDLGETIGTAMQTFMTDRTPGRTFADAAIEAMTSRPEVWDTALGVALEDLDPWEDPARTVDVLTLKGDAVARSILDTFGREKTARLLVSLREAHRGSSFTFDDLVAAGHALGANLDELLGDWLGSTELPGFVGTGARVDRLADSEDGTPRYQLLVTARNDEPVPGLFRIRYSIGSGDESERVETKPIGLDGKSAVRFGAVSSQPPTSVSIAPYLSLNRISFSVPLSAVDREKIVGEEPREGTEEVPWEPPVEKSIVVDDLDEGFDVTAEDDVATGFRLGARAAVETETDQGLPLHRSGGPPSAWSRMVSSRCWGKYRHTMAAIRAGSGTRSAVFTAAIPRAGRWDLELHMPDKQRFFRVRKWGSWNLVCASGDERREITFDSDAGVQGWNLVGSFDLPEGEIRVELSDRTDGQVVVADAVRWSPTAGGRGTAHPE